MFVKINNVNLSFITKKEAYKENKTKNIYNEELMINVCN